MDYKAKYKGGNTYEPISAEDFKKSLKMKDGDYVNIETWKERNIMFHRKYFALLNTTIYFMPDGEQFDRYKNIDCLRKELMIRIGEVDYHVDIFNNTHIQPKSINFRSMDEEKFERIYSLTIDAIIKHFLSHISMEDFEKYVLNFL